jgi:pantetheine-phosphate adenylyltransferase
MSHRIALFPGSFDPITLGHTEVVQRALGFFDVVLIAVGRNTSKNTMFTVEQRVQWIEQYFADEPRVRVESFDGLTVDFARKHGASYLLRGLRSSPDFEYEKNIYLLNHHLDPNIETVFLLSKPETNHISSTLVREVIRFKGEIRGLVPEAIILEIYPS